MKAPAIVLYGLSEESHRLRRVAQLASTFFIEDRLLRMAYLKEIDDFIVRLHQRMAQADSFDQQQRILGELITEREQTEKLYQKLRVGDYVKYIVTDIFEDQGGLKYAKVAAGVVSGGIQAWVGRELYKLGQKLHVKHLKSFGVVFGAHGLNNMYEATTPLLYDGHFQPGIVRDLYRSLSTALGYGRDQADFAYSAVDVSLTAYTAFKAPVLFNHPSRLIIPGFLEKPGTNKLFRYINTDYKAKFLASSDIMRIYLSGSTAYKAYATFYDGNHRYNDQGK